MNNENIQTVLSLINETNVVESIANIEAYYKSGIVFSTSFSKEDQAIAHIIFSNNFKVEVFTLDTGRHFAETYSTWSATIEQYKKPITPYYPDANTIQEFVAANGPNAFYNSIENRKQCCQIRKVAPLQQALSNKQIWITGIRAQHSNGRNNMPQVEFDEANNIIKYHPLLHWSTQEVADFISKNNIPYNPLQDKGYVSIGCQPCTRTIKVGDDFRAGRWWWEDNSKKECGLHSHTTTT